MPEPKLREIQTKFFGISNISTSLEQTKVDYNWKVQKSDVKLRRTRRRKQNENYMIEG